MFIKNETCFTAHQIKNKLCKNTNCKFWHDLKDCNNCILNKASKNEDLTLQEIGDLFGLTRMRVCQIEKEAIRKVFSKSSFIGLDREFDKLT